MQITFLQNRLMLLVCNIRNTVFIYFDTIVQNGTVKITDVSHHVLINQKISNSNFVKYELPNYFGKVNVKVNYDGESTSKQLIISKS